MLNFATSYGALAASLPGMVERRQASWIVYALGALLLGAIVAAVLVVGPASPSTAAQTRVVTAQRGVVQSTVSGSGNVEAASELNLGFKASGTVTHIYVKQGQQVAQGQLLATLDPHSAEVTLEQAKANLQSAEAALARAEETDGESSSSSSPATSADTHAEAATANATIAAVSTTPSQGQPTPSTPTPTTTTTTPQGSSTTPQGSTTTPKESAKAPEQAAKKKLAMKKGGNGGGSAASEGSSRKNAAKQNEAAKGGEGSSASSASSAISSATREANIASARAAVKSDRLTVENDERSVSDTKLTAPESGTIVSLGGEVGETVSGGGTSRAASESSESSSGSGGSGHGSGGGTNSSSNSSSNSSQSGSSSSAFAVLSDLSSMKLVVPLSESEVGSVRRGQTATVTVEALKGAKLAAHVSEVAALPTSNSGVVSYDVTFTLDQLTAGLKPGMSATAEVVVQQAEGVNVPTSAISGGAVTVVEGTKQVRRSVMTGLAGNSTTVVLSGLKAGERVALPLSSSSGSANLLSRLGSRGGAVGFGGRLGGLGGGGGFAGGGPRIAVGPGPGG